MFIPTVDTNEILNSGRDSDGHVIIVYFVLLGFVDRVNYLVNTQRYFKSEVPLLYILSH